MRICVIFNPTAKGGKARQFRQFLDTIAPRCALKLTRAPGAARSLAAEAVREGFGTIVAAGGDGTLNEVLNGIGDEPDGFFRARLAVLPLGTVNVFAKELGLPTRLPLVWEIIQRGREFVMDLPQVEFTGQGRPQRRYFAQLAGAGLDARAIELVDWEVKKRFAYLAYGLAVVKAWRETQSQITVSNGKTSAAGELVLIGNGRFYAGRFIVFPKANLRDGRLDVCVLPKLDWKTVAACAWGIVTRRLNRMRAVRHLQVETFSLTSPTRTSLEIDGERVGELPARFSLQRAKLRVIVPKS